MVVERWQLCWDQKNDNRRCIATKTIPQSDAAERWSAPYSRSGLRAGSVRLGPGPQRLGQSKLIFTRFGPHVSEELIAEALFPYPKGLVIATKGGWNRPGPSQWTHDATPAHLREAVEGSLKRLRLDRIDVYQLHTPDPQVSFEASVETLAELRNQGKIRLVALSNVTQEHIERARKIVPIVSIQNRYSFADREWDYVVDYCESHGIAFIPWFPLGAGRVAGEVLNQIAEAHHASPKQVALAWLLRRTPIMLPIPGTGSVEHLEENVAAASVRLSDEEYERLAEVSELVATR
jgi:pyridoxine 4-dehydrogenase